jgi:hypothetical protein
VVQKRFYYFERFSPLSETYRNRIAGTIANLVNYVAKCPDPTKIQIGTDLDPQNKLGLL